ncbi:MAG: hypothetical protein KIS96_02240 [Bauldia sp.]|nr:hypothetical protein [Bauldia sp.]
MQALLVYNPKSGKGAYSGAELAAALRKAGYQVTALRKKDPRIEPALAREPDLLVIAGGDGTVNDLLQWKGVTMPVAILPLGTANNIATSLGLPDDVDAMIAALPAAPVRRFAIGRVSGSGIAPRFLEGIGVGALASLMTLKERPRPRTERIAKGRQRLADALGAAEARPVKVAVDGRIVHDGPALMVEVSNIARTGSSLPMFPSADPGDDVLEIAVVDPGKRTAMVEWVREAAEDEPVPAWTGAGREVAVTFADLPFRVDDHAKPAGRRERTLRTRLLARRALQMVVSTPPADETSSAT